MSTPYTPHCTSAKEDSPCSADGDVVASLGKTPVSDPCPVHTKAHPHRARHIIIACVCVVLACVVSLRIYVVNATAVQLPVEHYAMGQWVDLNGTFFNKIIESPQGYSIKVDSAQLMSYNDYITTYGTDKSKTKPGFDTKSVINLEVEIKNVGNTTGAFTIFRAILTPERKDNYYIFNRLLFASAEKNQDAGNNKIALGSDTSYTTNIPYELNIGVPSPNDTPQPNVTDTSFELRISNSPVRKVIDITLGNA